MPFINGRYYMNPTYGAAVERARAAGALASESDDVSSEPMMEQVLAQKTPQKQSKPQPSNNQNQEHKAEVGYGETEGLLPQKTSHAPSHASPYDRHTWDKQSQEELQQARVNIMDISGRNPRVHKAKPGKGTVSQAVWSDNMQAAKNSNGSLPGKHFFIRQKGIGRQRPNAKDGWGQGKPVRSYGPFRNVGGGDVPKGDRTYIDIYDH